MCILHGFGYAKFMIKTQNAWNLGICDHMLFMPTFIVAIGNFMHRSCMFEGMNMQELLWTKASILTFMLMNPILMHMKSYLDLMATNHYQGIKKYEHSRWAWTNNITHAHVMNFGWKLKQVAKFVSIYNLIEHLN